LCCGEAYIERDIKVTRRSAIVKTVRRVSLWLPPLIYAGAIFYLSSQSEPLPELTSHVWDKALHAIEYSGLGILIFRALFGERLPLPVVVGLTAAIVSVYGASDEWHQSFVPMRSPDILDWMVDTLGGSAAAVVCALLALRPRTR
jgi:VanZ family protein